MDGPRRLPIHPALWRPAKLMGGVDRRLGIALGMVVAIMVIAVHTWYSFFIGLGLYLVGLPWLRRFASDPMGVDVFVRHVNRRGHLGAYAAQSRYTSVPSVVRAQVKG